MDKKIKWVIKIDIILDKVKEEDRETLYRLLEYSLYEESVNDGNEMNEEAIYEYKYFNSYFNDSNRYAFFIREKESSKLLGFAMINDYVQEFLEGHSIAEFMVLPKYRKNKIGKSAAIKCFDMFKGNWEVEPSHNSASAYAFWKKVVDEYTNGNNEFKNGIFIFNNNN